MLRVERAPSLSAGPGWFPAKPEDPATKHTKKKEGQC